MPGFLRGIPAGRSTILQSGVEPEHAAARSGRALPLDMLARQEGLRLLVPDDLAARLRIKVH